MYNYFYCDNYAIIIVNHICISKDNACMFTYINRDRHSFSNQILLKNMMIVSCKSELKEIWIKKKISKFTRSHWIYNIINKSILNTKITCSRISTNSFNVFWTKSVQNLLILGVWGLFPCHSCSFTYLPVMLFITKSTTNLPQSTTT